MKRRWFLFFVVLLALLLAACTASRTSGDHSSLQLYFLSAKENGPAIVTQSCHGAPSTPESLLQALLSGPSEDSLRSPFPKGLTLQGCTLEDTHLTVDFSEAYGGLTDVALTLADYCVVLTVCQLDGIDSVEITVSGRPLSYRSQQILTVHDAILATQ